MLRLRIDDLDPQRSRAEYAQAAQQDLRWLGLDCDGEPVLQSRRSAAYRAAWEQLVAGGWVYPCRCSRRDLRALAAAPHEHGDREDEAIYPGVCRPAWLPGAQDGANDRVRWLANGPAGQNWRFRVPDGEAVCFADGGFGPQRYVAGRDFGDFPVWRRDAVPAYQLATVVDDAVMGITEVVRGGDLLVSTARQLLLFRALGQAAPRWFHCALVRDAQGERLAKRSDALSVAALRRQGLTPDKVLAVAHSSASTQG